MSPVAKVVLPIALDKEFDYRVPSGLSLSEGMRVLVDFNRRQRLGLVVGLQASSKFKKLKSIITALDSAPLLDREKINLAYSLSQIYPYPPGEFLFMMLPNYLKQKHKTTFEFSSGQLSGKSNPLRRFIKADTFIARYQLYRKLISEKLTQGSVLICFPQLNYLLGAKTMIEKDLGLKTIALHSRQSPKQLFENWKGMGQKTLILGSRAALFYYPPDLRLIIAEETNSPHYFHQEKPFHSLIDVAFLISEQKNIDLVLSSDYPALNTYRAIKQKQLILQEEPADRQKIEVVRLGGSSGARLFNPVLKEKLNQAARDKKKNLIFWNYRSNEKITSQLRSILTGVGIDTWDRPLADARFTVATSKILSCLYAGPLFDRGFVLDADFSINRPDYDATFEEFSCLMKLSHLVSEKLYVFTHNPGHYLFKGLSRDWRGFYEKELSFRRKLKLDPFGLSVKVTLRAKNKNMLLRKANDLYNRLRKDFPSVYGPREEEPFKLHDKYRYSIVAKAKRTLKSRRLLKEQINRIRASSVQVAVSLR